MGRDGSNGGADEAVAVAPEASTGAATGTAATAATSGTEAAAAATATTAATGTTSAAADTATANRTSTPAAPPPTSVSRVPRASIVNPYAVRATAATTITAAISRQVGRGGSYGGGASEVVVTSVPEVLATATPTPTALPPSSVSKVPRAPLPPPVGRDGADHGRRPLLLHDAAAQGGAVSARGDDGLLPSTVSPVNPVTSHEGGGGGEHLTVDSGDGINGSSSSVPPGRRGEGLIQSRLGMGDGRPDSGGKGARGGPISGGGGGKGGGGCGGKGGGDGGGSAGSPEGHSLGGGGRGGEKEGRSGRGHEHAEWRNRVLASMENRMKLSASAGSSAAAAGGGGARSLSATAAGAVVCTFHRSRSYLDAVKQGRATNDRGIEHFGRNISV